MRGLRSSMNKAMTVSSNSRTGDRKLKLSALQEAVLHWLRREQRRRPQVAGSNGIPYPDLAQAFGVDRAELSTCLRRLVRKQLVLATLPRGSWVRYISLTEKAEPKPRQDVTEGYKGRPDARDGRERESRRSRRKTSSRRRGRWTPLTEMDE